MTTRLGVTGATGRMGGEVLAAASEREDCTVVFATSRSGGETISGVETHPDSAFQSLCAEHEPTAVIDFTLPEPAVEYAEACAETGVPFVTGTTGFSDNDLEALRAVSEQTALLYAPNFSRGVQVLLGQVGEAVASLPGYDVELIETHHNNKRDAPSGTATRLLEAIEANGEFGDRVHGREGEAPRQAGEIGVHALRAGNVTGEHEVVIAGNHEELRLTHRAEDRGVFAAGALDAATWIAGRNSGWYEFGDVLGQ